MGSARSRQRFAALVTLAAIGVIFGGAARARDASWLPPVNVSAPQGIGSFSCGLFDGQPGVGGVHAAVNASGETIASWTRANGGVQEVQASIRPPGGSFGPVQTVGTTEPCYFLGILGSQPKVAIDAQGDAVMVWVHPLSSTTVIQAAVRPAGGTFGTPVDLSDESRNADGDPDVAISASGAAVAVWSWNNGTHTVVQAATRPPGGAFPAAGTAATLSDGSQDAGSARVASDDRGDVAVAWRRSNGTNLIAQARVRPAGGSFASTVDLSAAGADADSPAVAIDPLGRATVVWTRANLIEARSLTAAGALDQGVDNVSDTAESVSFPGVAVDAANNAVAVWTGGSDSETKAASRASRASFGPPQTISGPGSANALPSVAMDPAGNAVAVWSQGLATIQAAVRPPGGSFGAVVDVSRGPGTAFIPSMAIDGEGNTVVGWTYFQSPQEVAQGSVFDAAPPTFTGDSVPATGTTGRTVAMSAAATDRWSGAGFSWSFGDGATTAGASVAHAYGAPGVYTVTVTATDGAGNGVSRQHTVQIANPAPAAPAPPTPVARTPAILVTLSFKYSAGTRSTKLTAFSVQGVPRGATVTATCAPPKHKGRTPRCPAKSFRKANAHGTVKVTTFVGKRFTRGTVIEVRVTAPGEIGAVKRLTIRGRSGPATSTLCLRPGATTPSRC